MVQGYSKSDLCGVGFAPEQADLITVRSQSAVQATGSVLSQAATSTADVVLLGTSTAANAGFAIRDGNAFARRQVVINATNSTMKLYPPSALASLNNQAKGTSIDIASGVAAAIDTVSDTLFWVRKGA